MNPIIPRTILVLGLMGGLWGAQSCLAEPKAMDAEPDNPNEVLWRKPWSVMVYRGWTSTKSLNESLRFQFDYAEEDMYAVDLAYTLAQTNPINRLLRYIRSTFQLGGTLAYRRDRENNEDVGELALYFALRWRDFPWNHYVATTLAIGEGISYATEAPEEEKEDDPNDSQSLMNFLVFEATFAHPQHPHLQLVYRLHHRSGAYGIFDSRDFGSNVLGLGVRYHF